MFSRIVLCAIYIACLFRAIAVKLEIGSCTVHIFEKCSSDTLQMYLFASERPNEPIPLNAHNIKNLTLPEWINLNRTNKLLVHGYGGNLEFFATKKIRNGKLVQNEFFLSINSVRTASKINAMIFSIFLMCSVSATKRYECVCCRLGKIGIVTVLSSGSNKHEVCGQMCSRFTHETREIPSVYISIK